MAKIKCKNCGDIIEGDGKGTYISCKCNKCAIDETKYYSRVLGNFNDYYVLEENKWILAKDYIEKEQDNDNNKNN